MQTDLITKVYFNEHLTHSCVGMPQGLQALLSSYITIGPDDQDPNLKIFFLPNLKYFKDYSFKENKKKLDIHFIFSD